ncbi:UDP-N-acetylmuramoyl-L-alanyl-D-glutamate--2,6-diaminopimelate ligase [Psychroflexus sp. ALD_RP9]|uniref:UDP-N-acetylmuramoyl-L-alanyl-D-glutamate--2, 6-diaminopimelate ligase n=1 Tax=Psychroflexus sp. ALD_RP9 TaxID=2777186 RepID=UPI001A9098F8|nr:UDP-N-acetylmuramoyl-L-alanyl-D-glutamate--2,6-diaminopimelate ligase [Psychroflexus sp. ALD_RP9]QSS96503.1 UDP-N-acetylmuramoyl-L-alanyl-D-glutamate--2,6-diaminopimelate ligase [Psychroflexus sp. ALD_RP9]
MKLLKDILLNVAIEQVVGSTSVEVNALSFDSRAVSSLTCFVAIRGEKANGHQFITKAIDSGASAIICDTLPKELVNNVTYIRVNDTREALAHLSNNFYNQPSQKLQLVGVTGTNGKTTVSSLLFQLFKDLGFSVGLISTVVIKINDEDFPTNLTTPDSITINNTISKMVEAGVEYCFMEVSSHGIDQKRSLGLDFDTAIFTNLSHDHLDYHNSFEEYRNVKKRLFDQLKPQAVAITNIDDKNGRFMLQNTSANQFTYAIKSIADIKAKILEKNFDGLKLDIDGQEIWSSFLGEFNVYNLLAVYATALQFCSDKLQILQSITCLKPVAGRFQHMVSTNNNVHAIVDYAHTPDALQNVLKSINAIRTHNETLITVVGCGGNRDKSKRPKMGKIATQLSDKVIFTSDNPRFEDPDKIIADIETGVEPQNTSKYVAISNRAQAIKTACQQAQPNDIILIAGKGHETYQDTKGVKHDFDDRQHIKQNFKLFKL